MAMRVFNQELLDQIEQLQLSDRFLAWKKAVNDAPWKVGIERQRLAMESWKETAGDDLEIRRAKMLKKILEGNPIKIYDFDLIVGRPTEYLLGTNTSIEVCGDHVPGLWEDGEIKLTMAMKSWMSNEEKEVLRECTRYFADKNAVDPVYHTWRSLVGSWVEDMDEAHGKDPEIRSGFLPGETSPAMWVVLLNKGLRGMINDAKANMQRFLDQHEKDVNKYHFWQASVIVCEAAIAYAHRHAELARSMAAEEQRPERKKELLEIADVCDRVPENPATTFHEALQFMQFVCVVKNLEHAAVTCFPSIGRADQYLWPFFKKDLENGVSLERLSDILCSSIGHWGTQISISNKQFSETHQASYGINNIIVGGVDSAGNDATNELSYLILHMVGLINMPSPTVNVRWHPNLPHFLMTKALETNEKTKGGIPLYQNDQHIIESFVKVGVPIEKARNYAALGCVTPVCPETIEHLGSEGNGAMNLAFIMDLALHNGHSSVTGKLLGVETGDPRDFKTFDDMFDAFKKQHEFVCKRLLWMAQISRETSPNYVRLPFLSTIISTECMKRGEDAVHPLSSDDYHNFGFSDRAVIDAADSLTAVKKLVFDDKVLTMSELMDALDSNFEGEKGEKIKEMCLNAPKFGNDDDYADQMVHDVSVFSANTIDKCNTYVDHIMIARGGQSWHYFGGLGAGALPNGRKALEPLNDGSFSPMRGADKKGVTGVLRSVLKVKFDESYATILNQKFSNTVMQSAESREKLAQLTETFLRNGGQHIQYNIVDAEELQDAKAHPENYKELVVRVGGFSAYFVRLAPGVQDDIILRSEQGC